MPDSPARASTTCAGSSASTPPTGTSSIARPRVGPKGSSRSRTSRPPDGAGSVEPGSRRRVPRCSCRYSCVRSSPSTGPTSSRSPPGSRQLEAVRDLAGVQAGLKWPNDVVVDDRKLAGILAEADGAGAVVVGMGCNVRSEVLPEDLVAIATAVQVDRRELLAVWLRAYDARLSSLDAIVPEAIARSATLGRRVRVEPRARDVRGDGDGSHRRRLPCRRRPRRQRGRRRPPPLRRVADRSGPPITRRRVRGASRR